MYWGHDILRNTKESFIFGDTSKELGASNVDMDDELTNTKYEIGPQRM